jgi:hypothetical protein
MFRKHFFAAYGGLVGLAFAAGIVNGASVTNPFAIAAWTMALVAVFSFFGWRLPRSPESPRIAQMIVLIPLAPFALLAGLLGLTLVVGVMLVPVTIMWPFWRAKYAIQERRRRNALAGRGRFITVDALRPSLDAGKGTLIVDAAGKGPYRVWWTEDDLFSLGKPVSSREDCIAAFKGEHAFNARCLAEYLDDNTGRALLTPMETRDFRGARLTRLFPQTKVATVFRVSSWPEARNCPEP